MYLTLPISTIDPGDGDGLEEADPQQRESTGRIKVQKLEKINSSLHADYNFFNQLHFK